MPAVEIPLNPARSASSASIGLTTPVEIRPPPACSESSASAEISTPVSIPLNPATATSSAQMTLTTGFRPLAYTGTATTVTPSIGSEIHWHPQQSGMFVLDGAMLATVVFVVAARPKRPASPLA